MKENLGNVDGTQGVTTPFSPYIFPLHRRIVAGETREIAGDIAGHRRFLPTLIKSWWE